MKRIALITDVTHFVGPPSARHLLADGITVYGADRSFDDEDARSRFASALPGIVPLAEQEADSIVEAVVAREGQLDVLINNDAYPAVRAPIDEAGNEELHATFDALVFKSFEMTRAAARRMKRRRQGKILFVSSAAPLNGIPNFSIYVTARGAANALALTLAKELAPFNIQVNAMAPNYVESPDYFPESLLANPDARAKILKNIPLGRLGKPEEAAALVAFLTGPQSDFITGQIVAFSGGWASAR